MYLYTSETIKPQKQDIMKKKLLKAFGILVATVVLLIAAGVALLHTDKVQNWLMQRFVAVLQEQLQTDN